MCIRVVFVSWSRCYFVTVGQRAGYQQTTAAFVHKMFESGIISRPAGNRPAGDSGNCFHVGDQRDGQVVVEDKRDDYTDEKSPKHVVSRAMPSRPAEHLHMDITVLDAV